MARAVGRAKAAGMVAVLGVALALGGGAILAKSIRCAEGEVCAGTRKADTIRGEGANEILGKGGNDTITSEQSDLDGGPGDDVVRSRGASVVLGGRGNDTLEEVDGIDPDGDGIRIGANVLDGGPGDDQIRAFYGASRLEGGPGDDVLRAKNGVGDDVDCGSGRDEATVDAGLDDVTNCETRRN